MKSFQATPRAVWSARSCAPSSQDSAGVRGPHPILAMDGGLWPGDHLHLPGLVGERNREQTLA